MTMPDIPTAPPYGQIWVNQAGTNTLVTADNPSQQNPYAGRGQGGLDDQTFPPPVPPTGWGTTEEGMPDESGEPNGEGVEPMQMSLASEGEGEEEESLESWTVSELKDYLDSEGIEYPPGSRKADLIDLVQEAGE